MLVFFFSSRRRHTRCSRDWSSDVCSSDLTQTTIDDVAGVLRTNAVGGLRPRTTAGIDGSSRTQRNQVLVVAAVQGEVVDDFVADRARLQHCVHAQDRKSTRLNSSHGYISYAVFCLKKKNKSNFICSVILL